MISPFYKKYLCIWYHRLKPEFICYRGLLSTLWRTPFEESEGWIVCAVKFKGTIYLCGFDTEEVKDRKQNATARELMMSSWGFKFEQYLLSGIGFNY